MKKFILLGALIGFSMLVNAQSTNFNSFKLDLGVGYATPSQGNTVAGAAFMLQPHYRLSDDFALGVRIEIVALLHTNYAGNKVASALGSGCLSGEYYLSDKDFRPFIGAGLGLFDQTTIGNNNGTGPLVSPRTINFGAFPEIGFEYGHFRLSIDYDYTGGYNNYFAANIGAFFGGGRNEKK
jgi:hypothetical protein